MIRAMKRVPVSNLFASPCLALLWLGVSAPSAAIVGGSLSVKTGDAFVSGDIVTVSWSQQPGSGDGKYRIAYSKNGGAEWSVLEQEWQGPSGEETVVGYSWLVPQEATSQGRLRVCQLSGGEACDNPDFILTAGNFSVTSIPLQVTSANGAQGPSMNFDAVKGMLHASFTLSKGATVLVQARDPHSGAVAVFLEDRLPSGAHEFSFFSKDLKETHGSLVFSLSAGGQEFQQAWNRSE